MDYYLEDRSRLNGQPKATIADYVEQNGILVPRRFRTFKEAKASGLPVIVRSELTQDYDGVSGLLSSPQLGEVANEGELKQKILTGTLDTTSVIRNLELYCRYLNFDLELVKSQISFSFWEHISGYNQVVVADSAIANRFHVMTNSEKGHVNYSIFDNGEIVRQFGIPVIEQLSDNLPKLINTYERIRHLSHFEPSNCPLMEFQTTDRIYFLQYLRSRDFDPSLFSLERSAGKTETEALHVRGATPPEGRDYRVVAVYSSKLDANPDNLKFDGTAEQGAYYQNILCNAFWELKLPHLQIALFSTDNLEYHITNMVREHLNRSILFKPAISLLHDPGPIVPEEELHELRRDAYSRKENAYLNLHIVSDGRKAYISRT